MTDPTTFSDKLLTESPQLYSGSEAAPTFLTGSFNLIPSFDGTVAMLTITRLASSVPEVQTWAMLLAGFGMIGAVIRRRNAAASVVFA